METREEAAVLILSRDRGEAVRWADALAGLQYRLWLSPDEIAPDCRLDLIVTDQEPTPAEREFCDGNPEEGGGLGSGVPAVVRIGAEGPGDMRLPADVTRRELCLACRLLTEIVRLRRKARSRTRLERRLLREALTDPLTGLPNRRAWERALASRLDPEEPPPGRLCLAILDLDHFKQVNDRHGHGVGDEVLRAVGQVIHDGLRESDFVARLGGDEIGLLAWVADEASGRSVVERVRDRIPERLAGLETPAVTASAGCCVARPEAASADALFAAADAALRRAKQRGRNRTEQAGED